MPSYDCFPFFAEKDWSFCGRKSLEFLRERSALSSEKWGFLTTVSEHTIQSGCFYVCIVQAALIATGAPENLVEVIIGFDETGEALVSSVDKIIFVGSPCVGRTTLVNDALDKRAKIAGRVSVRNIGECTVDQYFPPTVIINVNHTMKLMQEEAFGPIMAMMKFSSDEEAIELANDS
ncbi:unnamed protein product [Fraxinus pennsylvanica]|uniref:Aldehyde dehydrogenase domain-containing protein n=1 Tax=Fraxinus pennsylvanica TaxID=56036 RepID=A0AAD1ZD93_9LAMI|nr:unnamed protein product [Fraxinus pennsylvanica]